MATSIRDFERSGVCGATTMIAKQYYIVKQHTDGTLVLAGVNGVGAIGVLQNKPAVGASALYRFGGTSKVVAGGTIAVGAWVTSDTNGKAVATTTDKDVVIGRYLGTAAAASGDIIEVQMGIHTGSL